MPVVAVALTVTLAGVTFLQTVCVDSIAVPLVVIVTQFTTTSVPVAKSEDTAGQVVLVKLVIEYVVVTVGETLNV